MGGCGKAAAACVLGVLAPAFLGALPHGAAVAADLVIISNQGATPGVRELAAAFGQKTGHKVIISHEQIPTMNEKIGSGAPADVAAIAPYAAAEWISKGKIVAGTATNFAQAGVGVAVKAGAAKYMFSENTSPTPVISPDDAAPRSISEPSKSWWR